MISDGKVGLFPTEWSAPTSWNTWSPLVKVPAPGRVKNWRLRPEKALYGLSRRQERKCSPGFTGERFSKSAGESEQFYRIELPNGIAGWVWKGDIEFYSQPRYSQEQLGELRAGAEKQVQRRQELAELIKDLDSRHRETAGEVEVLLRVVERRDTEKTAARLRVEHPSIWNYDSLKARTALSAGFANQRFGADLGLAPAMLKGLGLRFKVNEKLSFDFSWSSGAPTVQSLGEDDEIPAALSGLDTLNLSASLIRLGLGYRVDASGVPLLKLFDNSLRFGLAFMGLEASAAGNSRSQNLWGPIFGWTIGKDLFSRLSFQAGIEWFVTSAEVTDVLGQGQSLLQRETRTVVNSSLQAGVIWSF